MESRIIVPLDYDNLSGEVVKIADEWAQRTKTHLHFLRVDEDYFKNGDVDLSVFESKFEIWIISSRSPFVVCSDKLMDW